MSLLGLNELHRFAAAGQPFVYRVQVVHQRNVEISVEFRDLIVVVGVEQAVLPAEGRVCVHDQVNAGRRGTRDVLEDAPAQCRQSLAWQVEDSMWDDIRRLRAHQLPDIEQLDVVTAGTGQGNHLFEEGLFVQADLAGDNNPHALVPPSLAKQRTVRR